MGCCASATKVFAVSASVSDSSSSPAANGAPDETQPRLSSHAAFGAFEARISVPTRLTGNYVVFVRESELIFIRRDAGGSPLISAILHLLGPVGGIVTALVYLAGLIVNLISNTKSRDKKQPLAQLDPYELLQSSKRNFKLHVTEVRHGTVHPYTFWALPSTFWSQGQGKAGRIDFAVRLGERLSVEFEAHDELATALHLLKPLLSTNLQINVVWNPITQRFERKSTGTEP